jgi:cyanate permease
MLLHVFKHPWTRLLFLSLTSWSLGQVSLLVQVVVVLMLTWSLGQDSTLSASMMLTGRHTHQACTAASLLGG